MSLQNHVRSAKEIDAIRESGKMLGHTLRAVYNAVEPDVTTNYLDEIARKEIKALGGKPAFYGYQGFPKTVCASINDEVVHGIPSERVLSTGDFISIDCGVNYKGMITDAAFTRAVGDSYRQDRHKVLLETTQSSLEAGISILKAGLPIGTLSAEIQSILASAKLGIVRDLVGHGVGRQLHEEPEIPNFGKKGKGKELLAGMTIAIEPMATLGTDMVTMAPDGWTISSRDGSFAAHFEHTVLVLEDGAEVLTLY